MNKKIQRLLDEIESEYKYTYSMTGKSSIAPKVKQALLTVPRDKFVPKNYINSAFYNGPLPIGHGQTISQPYIVALMTDLLELEVDDVVLEIGTGSGYQAAILSQLCNQVYTIEYVPALADMARSRFKNLGYKNIECKAGNGYGGWPEHAPFDLIVVAAAPEHVPQPLIDQLKNGGRLVIPVGRHYQKLLLIEKKQDGSTQQHYIAPVSFVPMTGPER